MICFYYDIYLITNYYYLFLGSIVKRVASSDSRQLKCEKEASSVNPELFPLKYDENGEQWICSEIRSSDPQFDTKLQVPPKPDSVHNLVGQYSYVHVDGDQQIVNCFESRNAVDQLKYSAAMGFFPVVHVNEDVKYLCIHAHKLQQSLGDRLARSLSTSCEQDDLE